MNTFTNLLRQSLPYSTPSKTAIEKRRESLRRPLFYGTDFVYEESNSDDEGENRLEDRFPVDEDLVSASFFLNSKKRLDQLRTGRTVKKEIPLKKSKGAHLDSAMTADTLTTSVVVD